MREGGGRNVERGKDGKKEKVTISIFYFVNCVKKVFLGGWKSIDDKMGV